MVLYFDDEHRGDEEHPRAIHYRKASAAMDRLIELWNLLDDPMPRRDGCPPSAAVRDARADRIDRAAWEYRRDYRRAYGNGCFKPYTHMTRHLGDCQRRVQYDLHRYSCESQEHYGKVMKTTVTKQTNYRLGKKNLHGKYTPSYIQQAMQVVLHRKQLMAQIPVRASDYSRRKAKDRREQREARRQARAAGNAAPAKKPKVERQAGWVGCHTPMTMKKKNLKFIYFNTYIHLYI